MAVPPTPTPPATSADARPWATGLGLLLPLGLVVALLLLVLAALAGTTRWLLFNENGSRWLVNRLPFVEATGFKGALLGDTWRAERLRLQWSGGQQWLLIEDLAADGLRWHWRPDEHAWAGIEVRQLFARKATLQLGPTGPRPVVLPARLAPPLRLLLADARIDEFVVDDSASAQQLTVQGLTLDPAPGGTHRIQQFGLQTAGATVAGTISFGNSAPYPLAGQATARPTLDGDSPRWAAALRAGGTAALVDLTGTLRGRVVAGRAAPMLDLRAGLRPLQAWVLASLSVQTQALDLAALSPKAPATRLSGQAELKGGAQGTPLTATAQIDNALPGRWNEGRLPLRRLTLEMHGQLEQPERLDITRFELALADATGAAGRWSGSAAWLGHELALDTRLDGVTPQRLDSRAAAMTLTGPVAATLRGLPSPDFNTKTLAPPAHIEWKLDLQGQLDAAPQTVQLVLEGNADEQRLELRRLHAQSGNASAELSASVARAGRGEWQVKTTGTVLNFDPIPWWPGQAGMAWRQGPHRLSGDWKFDLRLRVGAHRLPPLALAQRLVGNGSLRIHDSLLAGVPLSADIKLGYLEAAERAAGSLHAQMRLGGNVIVVEGRGDPAGSGESDHWQVDVKADTLAALAPLAKLDPALANWVPRQGTATATLAADGRWPHMSSEGSARGTQLQVGGLGLARGTATWRIGTRDEQPLALQLDLAGLAVGKQRADHLRLDLRGTLAEHRIEISGAMPLVPPPLAVKVLGVQAQTGTQAQLQAQGSWLADSAGGGRWRARIDRLLVGSWDGSAAAAAPASGWAQARDLRAELQFNGAGKLVALHAEPGRVHLADAVALRWDEVKLDLRDEHPRIELHADIEPFALAPLLARAQPGMGWQGDLRLAARVDIRAAERFDADLVFTRRDGDLHVASSEGMQLLGLSELQVTLAAHDGLWVFNPVFKGRSLGEIAGSVRVQTTPERRWPHAEAAVEGSVQARAADIGIWSAWAPPGWRLTGELRTMATLGGRFGEPRYTGEITGTGLGVRNLLQGVNVSDGQVSVRLTGDQARIERFTLRGGDGSISITGGATFGTEPRAQLQLKAERFRLIGRVDRTVIASGNAALALGPEQGKLDGRFSLDEGLFDATRGDAPSLDDDVTVRRPGGPEDVAADAIAPRARGYFVLGLDIDLGERLRVRGHGLDTTLLGKLRLTNPGGRLAVNGTINADSGTYIAYAQKLMIERGIVAFSGPPENPRLDVLALRPNLDTRVGVAITGNLLTPRVRLYSEPEMSETDKLAWLLLGRAPDGLGRNDTALLQRAAMALLAGEGEAPTDALLKNLGIDELSLRQGDTDVRETVITLGKQLSRRWYVGYERGVNATTGTWQLIYRIAQRFTLRAQSGLDNSLDAIWVWRLQETPADAGVRKSTVVPP